MSERSIVVTTCEACDNRGWNFRDARIQPCDCDTYDPPKWVRRGDAACVISHRTDPDRPRRAYVGYACAGHRAKIEQMIAELPALYDDLAVMLAATEHGRQDGRKHTRSATSGLSLNDRVVDAREEIHAELVRMVRWVAEQRQNDERWPADTVPAMSMWLLRRLDWLCEQLDVDETHDNLDRLTHACRRLAYPAGRRRLEIGPCGKDDCPGTLITVTSRTADLLPESIWCDDCGRLVKPAQWRQLRRELGDDTEVVLTVTQACDAYDVPFRTLSRWVAEGRLTNVSDGHPAKVRAVEVEEIMQKMGVLRDSA